MSQAPKKTPATIPAEPKPATAPKPSIWAHFRAAVLGFTAGVGTAIAAVVLWHTTYSPKPQQLATAAKAIPTLAPARPDQQVFIGSPRQIQTDYVALKCPYGITQLAFTGYTTQAGEKLPQITAVVTSQQEPDLLFVDNNPSSIEVSVNHALQAGYQVKFNLVGLPAFEPSTRNVTHDWYLIALTKRKQDEVTERLTLFEVTPRHAHLFSDWIKQGWRILQADSRPTEMLTNHNYLSPMTAIVMERSDPR